MSHPDEVILTADEARFLALTLLDAIEPMEAGAGAPDTWVVEARLWVDLLLSRLQFGGDG